MVRTRPRSPSSAAPTPRVTEGYKKKEQGIYESTMPSARWAPWTSSRQGLLGHSYLMLLSRASPVATRCPRPLHGCEKRVELSGSLFRCLPHCYARVVPKRQGKHGAISRVISVVISARSPCTSARVCARLGVWRPTLCTSGRQGQRMLLPWPRFMPKLGAAPIAGSFRISRLNA